MPGTATAQRPVQAYRGFAVEVARVRRLSPSFLRMTFTGPDLDRFATTGFDQRIKLVLPAACGAAVDAETMVADDWYDRWRAKPEPEREVLRTYTVRAVRPELREVDVDVVLHGVAPGEVTTRGCGLAELLGCTCTAQAGPAVRWCAAARQGDPIVLVGPDAAWDGPPSGIEWRPPADVTSVLLAGDETAVPAICGILERLPHDAVGRAFLEVPTVHDRLDVSAPPGVEVVWLPRSGAAGVVGHVRHGSALVAAVRAAVGRTLPSATDEATQDDAALLWDVPPHARADGGLYAWVAAEAGVARELRGVLRRELGLDRSAVAVMGYWRAGRAEAA